MKNNFKILSLLVVFGFGCSHLEKPVVETASETPSFIKLDDDLPTYLEMNKRMPTALSVYKMTGQCGGLPRVEVKTAPGFCVGQIDAGDGLVFPRTALALPTGEILLVDMGGWTPMNGRIYLYKKNSAGGYTRSLLFNAKVINNPKFKKMVDRPNQISMGPDRKIYVGAPNAIVRFRMDSPDPQSTFEMVVDNIPNVGLHPLKAFTFDNENSLFVNLGSATNVCQKSGSLGDKLRNCPEVEENEKSQALVRKYRALPNGTYDPNYEIYSRGFRNSMVLLWDSYRQVLLQAENGRDAIDKFNPQLNTKKLPHEELNIVRPGKHYGWPYCYDNNLVNPEWAGHNCDHYEKPYLLLPPHSAPLSALLYQGNMLPAWYQNRVIMSLHGYEEKGHRLVTFLRDDRGMPTGVPLSIVYGWDARGTQLQGSPVGVSMMPDGSLLIAEDKSRKLLRVFYDPKVGDGKPVREIDGETQTGNDEARRRENLKHALEERLREPEPPIFSLIQDRLIDKHCASCHTGENARGLELGWYDDIGNERRIREHQKAMDIFIRIGGAQDLPDDAPEKNIELAPMPPDGFPSRTEAERQEHKNLRALFKRWMDGVGAE